MADAFHYLNDLVSFLVALGAIKLSERQQAPLSLAFGWQRARVLGAFFNGVFLLALGLSVFLQSIERFICPEIIEEPLLMLIMGCVGVGTNLICILLVHEGHEHHNNQKAHVVSPELVIPVDLADLELGKAQPPDPRPHRRDLGIHSVVVHIIGDVLNNLGVIAAALIMKLLKSPNRMYADPALSMAIAIMISSSAIPLIRKSGHILLGSAPPTLKVAELTRALKEIPGLVSVHELRVWRLNQDETIASAHIVVSPPSSPDATPRSSPPPPVLPLTSRRRSQDSVVGGEQLRRESIGAQTSNERLRRIGQVFNGFGIQSMTLQVEDQMDEGVQCGNGSSEDASKSCHVETSSV
ncbi:hypothetical protein MBLNU459_g6637t1 [Dothideomycetes sp. NU459]